jgi:hypothetical protein
VVLGGISRGGIVLTTANLLLVIGGVASTALILGFDCLEKRRPDQDAIAALTKNGFRLPYVFRPQRLIRQSRTAINAVMRSS